MGGPVVRPVLGPCPRLAQCPSETQATALDAAGTSEGPLLEPEDKMSLMISCFCLLSCQLLKGINTKHKTVSRYFQDT